MISKNTVLVLGAGTSCHLGFPLGKRLIEEVCRFVFGKSNGIKKERNAVTPFADVEENSVLLARFMELSEYKKENGNNYTAVDVKQFAEDLYEAQPSSIDTFLSRRSEYKLLGKICIIFCLSKYEDKDGWLWRPFGYPDKLNTDFPNFGWYQYLWSKMIDGVENIGQLKGNNLTIITFNYDRSLEYYLMRAIQKMFGVSEMDAAEVFKNIRIKHVYGKLGKFYWEKNYLENNENDTSKDYMLETNPFTPWDIKVFFRLMGSVGEYGMEYEDFQQGRAVLTEDARRQIISRFNFAVKEITTYYENIEEDKTQEYFKDLQDAYRIYFLGFGYDEQNLKSLGLIPTSSIRLKDQVRIWGTAYGMSSQEKELHADILRIFVGNRSFVQLYEKWDNMDRKEDSIINSFFRNVAPLE